MSNRVDRRLQNGAGTETLPRSCLLRLVRTSSVAGTKPVVATRNGSDIHGGQRFKVWSLRELEAENTELRNTAIQLALEIQDLRVSGNCHE
jgi:hypothetical protein